MLSTSTSSLWRCSLGLVMVAAMAYGQAGQIGPIHVDPPDPKVGILISVNPHAPDPRVTSSNSSEAASILRDLGASNGMDESAAPWHAELTYDQFDEDGDNVHSGTVEEFYVTAKKYRTITKTDEFTQTEVANGSELYRAGDQGWPSQATLQAVREVFTPLHQSSVERQGGTTPDKLDWTVGKTILSCVVLRGGGNIISANGLPKFCYEPGTRTLRYTRGQGWDETVYNDVFLFQQHYVARDVEVTHAGKPFLKIHLTKIDLVPQVDESLFLPPAGSPGPLTGVVTVPSGILMSEYLAHRSFPFNFPKGARGHVTVKFDVGKDGHVVRATATDGPDELRKPAETEVMKMEFRPFLILGKAVEVESTTSYDLR